MHLQALFERLRDNASLPSISGRTLDWTYADLASATRQWCDQLTRLGAGPGIPIAICSGFEHQAIACFLASLQLRAVAVLLAPNDPRVEDKCRIAGAQTLLRFGESGYETEALELQASPRHPLIDELMQRDHPGFVVFSSGSSGEPKAVLHDAEQFCAHLANVAKAKSTIALLTFDHIAGVDTLLYTLFAGGTLVIPEARTPSGVCQAIEQHGAQVLPASPSFLKLLMLSTAWRDYDLSSLEIITFGSEPPDARTSKQLAQALPGVTLLQKYGTSEFGAPRSKTRKDNSNWIKLEGPNFATKIINDVLWVKASGTMLGYLNHEFPEQRDGWLCTGDRVEQDGEWLRILGRTSDLINVGGDKVFPAEVERCIEQMPQILECSVSGETHELLGNIVVATIRLQAEAQLPQAKRRIRDHCAAHLPRYAIPMKVTVTERTLTNERGKRIRR